MRGWLGSAFGTLARHRFTTRQDASVHRELRADARALGLPAGLSIRWLGTAGFALSCEGFDLLIDPYLTRASLRTLLRPPPLRPDEDLLRALVPRASAILVGHTHFDHALDVPPLAAMHGCRVHGSRSLVHLMGLHGLGHLAALAELRKPIEIGPFEVTFVPSAHSKLGLGLGVPAGGELTCDHLDRLRGDRYRCGDVFGLHVRVAGVSFYHVGSANLIEAEIPFREVDVLLAGIGGRFFTRDYAPRLLRALSPRLVVPQHFDDLFAPVTGPLGFSPNVNLGGFVDDVARVSRDVAVRTLEPLRAVAGGSARPTDPAAPG